MFNLTKSSNPAFSKGSLKDVDFQMQSYEVMTLQGTINKTFISFMLLMASAIFVWNDAVAGENVMGYMIIGFFVSLVVFFITVFNKKISNITVPLYAIFEGMLLGGLSGMLEVQYPGIPMKAVMLTMSTFLIMLFCYKTGVIKATEKFKSIIIAATGGIFLVYLMGWVMSFFGINLFIYDNSYFGIGFSIVVVVIAALSLILDFSMIEDNAKVGAPKYMEWYCSFGLMITLIWLYLEFLRLLVKLQSRD